MQLKNRWGNNISLLANIHWRKIFVVCKRTIVALICTIYSIFPCSYAANHIEDDGNSGILHVHGALTESACRLNMASEWQDINLGEIGTARLAHIGDQGHPVVVQLYLRDCQRTGGQYDERTGNFVWAAYQPAVSVSFTAVADVDNPQLIQIKGSSGLALRLTDKYGRDVRLGSRGKPLLLIPGQDALTYRIIPERTRAPLRAGAYSALVNFRLNYE